MTEKTAYMPSQNALVATAYGTSLRQETRPSSKNHIVNHQKPMNPGMLTIHHRTGKLARNPGPLSCPGRSSPRPGPADHRAQRVSRPPGIHLEHPLVQVLNRGGRGGPGQDEEDPGQAVTALEVAEVEVNR
jgi:hypothetical protein